MPAQAILPCYILAGPETGKRNSFIQELLTAVTKTDGAAPEIHHLYAADSSVENLIGLLQNGSLFASRRFIEYRGAEAVTAKADIDALAAYLKSPADDAILLLVTDTYGLAKPLESAVGTAGKKIFWEMRDSEKPGWIRQKLAEYKLSIENEAIEIMLELVENETSALASACVMFGACFPADTRISADMAEAVLSRSREEDAFSLFDRLITSDLETCISVLDTVLSERKGDAAQIVSALVWSFRKLEKLHRLIESRMTHEEAFRQEKIMSKTAQRQYRAGIERYSREDCERIVRATSQTESALRTGLSTAFARPLLHLLVHAILIRKGKGDILSAWKEQEYYQVY